jgi:3-hydroxyacyl-CoA dehydrogenase
MVAVNALVDLSIESEVAIVTLNSPPVNALSAPVREGLTEALKRAVADTQAKAIVLICAGRTFIAGADISEFDGSDKIASIEDLQETMETSPKPVVVAIHGTALGGGLEVALCAHYRIAASSARCGLPEVNLGLLPGGGGTQRLPRAVGVEKALEMVTSGRHVPASECVELGLVDALVPDDALRAEAIVFAKNAIGRPLKRVRDNEVRANLDLFSGFRKRHADQFRGFKAPESNIQCIEASVALPFEEGLKIERKLFLELMTGEQSAAQRYIFFAERQAGKVVGLPADTPTRPIRKVWLEQGATRLFGNAAAFVGDPADCDLAVLVHGAGNSVARTLSSIHPDAILAGPDVKALSAFAKKPELAIGLRTDATRLAEIARTEATHPTVVATVMKLARSAGKVAVLTVGDFISERLLAAQATAITALLRNGVPQWQIDRALYNFGFTTSGTNIQSLSSDTMPDEEIVQQCIFPLIDEGMKLLAEMKALQASDIDVVWTIGHGWPAYRGGPMYYANKLSPLVGSAAK